ncbi:MAG: hypothetical protein NZT92_12190 [Abditibacteriales bacterium]|nr:hypothetical protein [Abditibacteriales bacterium]
MPISPLTPLAFWVDLGSFSAQSSAQKSLVSLAALVARRLLTLPLLVVP